MIRGMGGVLRSLPSVALLGVLLNLQPAHATLVHDCYVNFGDWPWFSPKTVVPVYMNNSGTTSFVSAIGTTQFEAEAVIRRALYLWNEQGGSSVKLRYMGPTSSSTVNGALTIVGDNESSGERTALPVSPTTAFIGSGTIGNGAGLLSTNTALPGSRIRGC